jgi:TatA/E family protein of Tat protein translocase
MPTPGPLELVIILVIALLILGPGKLPDVGSALGKSIREFRKASSDVQDAVNVNVDTSPLPPAAAPTAGATAAGATTAATSTIASSSPATTPDAPVTPVAPAAPAVPAAPTSEPSAGATAAQASASADSTTVAS